MGGHFKVVCRDHGTVYTQCRCPSPDKLIRQESCRCTPEEIHLAKSLAKPPADYGLPPSAAIKPAEYPRCEICGYQLLPHGKCPRPDLHCAGLQAQVVELQARLDARALDLGRITQTNLDQIKVLEERALKAEKERDAANALMEAIRDWKPS